MLYSTFIASFPEFGDRSQSLVERTITQCLLECDGYEGITNPMKRELAIGLLIAHTITCEKRSENPMEFGLVTEVKSKNDTVKFALGDAGGFNLDSTQYGVRLQRLLISSYPFP